MQITKSEKNYSNLIIYFFGCIVFFGHLISPFNYYHLFTVFLIVVIAANLIFKKKIAISIVEFSLWIVFILIMLFSSFLSDDIESSLKFIYLFTILICIFACINNNLKLDQSKLVILQVFSSLHVLATLFQYLFPVQFNFISKLVLNQTDYMMNQQLQLTNSYAGLTGQTGVNSFFILLFLTIVFNRYFVYKSGNRIVAAILFSLGLVSLLLTGKRGALAIIVIVLLTILFIKKKDYDSNKSFTKSFSIVVFLSFIVSVIWKMGFFDNLILKNTVYSSSGDLLNGRTQLWNDTLNIFKNNLLGVGINNIDSHLKEYSHNVYLQLTAEMGILGILIYLIILAYYFITTLKIIRSNDENDSLNKNVYINISLSIQLIFIIQGFLTNNFYSSVNFIVFIFSIVILHSKFMKENINEI